MMRTHRAALLAALALAFMPTSSSDTSPCPHRPLWSSMRWGALGRMRGGGVDWDWHGRRGYDNGEEHPPAHAHDWRNPPPPPDHAERQGGYYQGQGPVQRDSGVGWEGRGGGSGNRRGGGGVNNGGGGGDGRDGGGWSGGGVQGRGRGMEFRRSWRGGWCGRYGTAAHLSATSRGTHRPAVLAEIPKDAPPNALRVNRSGQGL